MSITELLEWQWQGYINYHQSKINLLLHILTVPLFISAMFSLLWALINVDFIDLALAIFAMATAMFIQGFGHAREKFPVVAFNGIKDATLRVLLEQFITFPKFVVSGNWWLAFMTEND